MFDPHNSTQVADRKLASDLFAWAMEQAAVRGPATVLLEEERDELERGLAEGISAVRQGIDIQFGKVNFADPALRVMLEVIMSDKAGRKISVEGLWVVTGIDRVVVAEALDTLADHRLVTMTPEKCDGRHLWIQLSDMARASMFDLFLQTAEFLRPRGCGLPL